MYFEKTNKFKAFEPLRIPENASTNFESIKKKICLFPKFRSRASHNVIPTIFKSDEGPVLPFGGDINSLTISNINFLSLWYWTNPLYCPTYKIVTQTLFSLKKL